MRSVILLAFLLLVPLRAEIVDRIVAVVDGRVITWSAALAEANYQAFQNGQPPLEKLESEALRKIVSQMVDQQLLEKEKEDSPFSPPEEETQRRVSSAMEEIRKRFSNPEAYQKALTRYRLTESELTQHLKRESDMLAFIDFRLRPQVRVAPEEMQAYYRDTLVPELRRRGQAEVPPLAQVRGQIEQILSQQEINRLLEAWLKELHDRAKIKLLL